MLDPAAYLRAARVAIAQTLKGVPQVAREECEGAAIEQLVRRTPDTFALAVVIAKAAAIDELRRWTHYNRSQRRVPLEVASDADAERLAHAVSDPASDALLLDWIEAAERASERLSERERRIIARTAAGATLLEIARDEGLSEARICQLYRSSLKEFGALADRAG